jgi:putative tryptophan/tyrosine transport system substrate-binding protein
MKRREFITLIGGATAAWPLAARAQPGERMRRIGWLAGGLAANDPESRVRNEAFLQALHDLGWVEGHNMRIDYRWGAANVDTNRKQAAELIALAPDVVLANASQSAHVLLQESRTVPIVFVQVPDPVGAGFVESLARPGGNATGFTVFEYGIGAKWLELLKEIAPPVKRVAVLRDPSNPAGSGQWGAIQSVAPSFGVELSAVNMRVETGEIEHAVAVFARQPNGSLILTASAGAAARRDRLIKMAARHKLPTVYPYPYYVASGGLISYGPDAVDQYRRAAGYVDRILKGEKAADLPVQAATKYILAINLKTAKTLGLEVPPQLLARADEVIE